MSNPLLEKFNMPFSTAPFSKIKTEHFKPAFIEAIANARKEIDSIINLQENPSFKNTIEALDFSGKTLNRITSIFFNLNSAETNDDIQRIAQEVSPLLTEFSNDINLNKYLFSRVHAVYKIKDKLNLTVEQNMLLTKKYKSFVRNGAHLKAKDKENLRKIDTDLAKLKLIFGENLLAETNAFELHIRSKEDLKGLPETVVDAAQLSARKKKKEGWLFTLDYPSYIPFMTYAQNRKLRKKMAIAFGAKAFQNNKNDNQKILLEVVNLRHQRAVLLGYDSHAHFVLEDRMAENPENVSDFLEHLLEKAKPAALREFKQLSTFAQKDGVLQIEKWDSAYYSEMLKKELFDLDQEQLKPYFKLENVIRGVFEISLKLYDLKFEELNSIDKYHEDVKTYKVTDSSNNYLGILYTDFFPRKGKRAGAWMTSFKGQWIENETNSRPHVSIVCNFTKPTETKPALLSFIEVTTLFHEFGHALHGILANTTYQSLSGTSVSWDFVELPSQIFENWCYEEEALKIFARHYKTGQQLPMSFIEKIKNSSNFLEGIQTMRQLSFGILDMQWHSKNPSNISNVKVFEVAAFKNTQLYPDVKENCMSTSFSHIFQGGYSSGYYSYKWAEVLDADAFSLFQENGIFDKYTAEKFKSFILEKGGTENPMELYLKFREKKPTNAALLKRAGLLT